MANVDMKVGGTVGHSNISAVSEVYSTYRHLDLAKAVTKKGSALAATDTFDLFVVPAGTLVLGAAVEVVTAGAGGASAATVTVGDSVDPARYAAAASVLASGYLTTAATAGHLATANETVRVTLASLTGGALTSGTIRVALVLAKVDGQMKNPGSTI